MRILLIANDFPSPALPTKAVFNRELVRALAAAGHDVEVIAPIPWPEELAARRLHANHLPPGRRESVAGVPIEYPRYLYPPKVLRNQHGWFYWASIRAAVRRSLRRGRPDVVLGYWVYPDGDAAVRAAALAGVPSAVIVGGSDVLLLPKHPTRRRRVIDVLRRVDRVITVNQHLRSATAALGIDAAKICTWSQGIDPARFHTGDRAAARKKLGITDNNPILLWVGRMVPVKGLDVLIEAAALLRDAGQPFRLILIGDGPLRAAVAADCAARGIAHQVDFIGTRSPDPLADWYRAADRVLLSSHSEGLPNVLREAQACGTPFIASDVGGIREIASPADRLFPAGNAAALAAAVGESLAMPHIESLSAPTTWAQSAQAMVQLLSSIHSKSSHQLDAPGLPRPVRRERAGMRVIGSSKRSLLQKTTLTLALSRRTGRGDLFCPPPVVTLPQPSPERAPAWTPRQIIRRAMTAALPRQVLLAHGPRTSNAVCLTFDDGPHPQHTPALLEVLRDAGVSATFFVIGSRAARWPDLLRRIAAEGHTLAHHTHTHGDPAAVSAEQLAQELQQTADLFRTMGVPPATLFRPPLGKLSIGKLLVARRGGLTTVLWSRDAKDYQPSVTPQQLRARFADRPLVGGDVVLFHDLWEATALALPQIIAESRAAGLRFTTPLQWIRARPVPASRHAQAVAS